MTNRVKWKFDYIAKMAYEGEVKDGKPNGKGVIHFYAEMPLMELTAKLNKGEIKLEDVNTNHNLSTVYLQGLSESAFKNAKPCEFEETWTETSFFGHFKEGVWDGSFQREDWYPLRESDEPTEDKIDYEEIEFKNGEMIYGRIDDDGGYYLGYLDNMKCHGEGEYHYLDPDNEKWIRGTWVNDQLTKIDYIHESKFFPNNNIYDGGTKIDNIKISKDWRIKIDSSGIPDGYGSMTSGRKHDQDDCSQIYYGMWKDGIMHGKGTLIEKGEYTNIGDLRNYDTHPFEAKKYVGEMKNGKANGEGVLSYIRIKKDVIPQTFLQSINNEDFPPEETKFYEGSFKDNLFHGQGTIFYHDGTSKKGEWVNGNFKENN